MKDLPISRHHHHHPSSDYNPEDRGALVVRSRPLVPSGRRNSSPESNDYSRAPRRRKSALVLRPRKARSISRVRIKEPKLVAVDYSSSSSSSDDEHLELRRSRRGRDHDAGNTHIRATSRPGEKNQYAFVRKRSKSRGRRKSDARAAVVHDLELKTDPRYKEFKRRRDELENTEALILVRARSRDRVRGTRGGDDSDSDAYYEGLRRYAGETRQHHRASLDDDHGRREIIDAARDDRSRDTRRSARKSKQYTYGSDLIIAHEDDLRGSTPGKYTPRRRVSLSPSDRGTITSSRRASSLTRAQEKRRSHLYNDRAILNSPKVLRDPKRDSAYYTDSERRASATDREREAIEREKRAIEREKAALDREKLVVDREKRTAGRDAVSVDDRDKGSTMGLGDYLKQGNEIVRGGQKYYKTGQGVVGGLRKLVT